MNCEHLLYQKNDGFNRSSVVPGLMSTRGTSTHVHTLTKAGPQAGTPALRPESAPAGLARMSPC